MRPEDEVVQITLDELKEGLPKMKFNKSRGPNDFPIDLIKTGDDNPTAAS